MNPLHAVTQLIESIRSIGIHEDMDEAEKRRHGIFNLINFSGFLTGIIIPIIALLNDGYLPPVAWVVAASPAFISAGVLLANFWQRYGLALFIYFALYPLVTASVYLYQIDPGIELFFIFYAVLAIFFLKRLAHIIPAIMYSLLCYSAAYLVKRHYMFVMADINYGFYIFNHILALLFIFGGLYLIKQENRNYQADILASNSELNQYSLELEAQKNELAALNAQKTKLFSIISHDVRVPLYGLRNLFKTVHDYDLPATEIKKLIPDVLKDLNTTTELMENLLQWARSQMKGQTLQLSEFDLTDVVKQVLQLLRLQAENKSIQLVIVPCKNARVYADIGMINTVIRNLVSNAIKFTPEDGSVTVAWKKKENHILVEISDTGVGMDEETLVKIFREEYFTTKGTANENGTGLGIMICKDFVQKNGGSLTAKSSPGNGTTFQFTIPCAPIFEADY